jgi:competence protein ComEA
MEVPAGAAHPSDMHDAESRSLKQAAILLMLISVVRWGWTARASEPGPEEVDVLPELLAASREAAAEGERRGRPLGEGERLDPNRADEVELDRLPGVGPSTARALVAARDSGAVFRRAEDLLAVRGIGPTTVDRLRGSLEFVDVPPSPRLPATPAGPARAPPAARGPVDVNAADLAGLQSLPGIGPAIAERILVTRREQPFVSIDDLARVRGIGPATVERLRPHVVVGPRSR